MCILDCMITKPYEYMNWQAPFSTGLMFLSMSYWCCFMAVLFVSRTMSNRSTNDRKMIAKQSRNPTSKLRITKSTLETLVLPTSKPPSNEHSGKIEILEEIDFSSTESERNISKDRWPSENDIKMYRCYNSSCAINLLTIDLRSICIKASDGFHVAYIKKKSRTCSLYLHLVLVWRLLWWSFHAGSMENWCRFHGGFM